MASFNMSTKYISSDSLQFQTGVARAYGALCGRVWLLMTALEFNSTLFIHTENDLNSEVSQQKKEKRKEDVKSLNQNQHRKQYLNINNW